MSSSSSSSGEEEEETDNDTKQEEESSSGEEASSSSDEEESKEEDEELPLDLKDFVCLLQQLNECMVCNLPIGDLLHSFPDHDKIRLKDEAKQTKAHLDSVMKIMIQAQQHLDLVIQ